jgi:hypothetical protein
VGHAIAGEGLQPGAIGAEAEFAIPQGQVLGSIIQGDVVPRHHCVAVNRSGVLGWQGHKRRQHQKANIGDCFHFHCSKIIPLMVLFLDVMLLTSHGSSHGRLIDAVHMRKNLISALLIAAFGF